MFSKWAALLVILGVGSAALLGPNAASAQPNYLVSLETGPANPPLGLNNNGQALLAKGIYSGGTFTPFPAGFTGSAINARGDVAGLTAAGDLALYSGGVVTDLAAPPGPPPMPGAPPNQFVFIGAINASDEIVGTMFDYADLDSGFIYSGGVLTPIRPVLNAHGAESEAQGLNDSGVVTGCQDSLPGYPNEAYSLANGIVTDLGPGCGAFVTPSGEIVGYGGGGGTAIFSSAGIELIPNSGPPTAVNSSGQIVGFTQAPNGQVIGFFYDGVVTDVNLLINASDPLKSSVTIDRAVGINDHRLLLLDGHDPLGNHQAYLLQAGYRPRPTGIRGAVSGRRERAAGPDTDQLRHHTAVDRQYLRHGGVHAVEHLSEPGRSGRQLYGVRDLHARKHGRRPHSNSRCRH